MKIKYCHHCLWIYKCISTAMYTFYIYNLAVLLLIYGRIFRATYTIFLCENVAVNFIKRIYVTANIFYYSTWTWSEYLIVTWVLPVRKYLNTYAAIYRNRMPYLLLISVYYTNFILSDIKYFYVNFTNNENNMENYFINCN